MRVKERSRAAAAESCEEQAATLGARQAARCARQEAHEGRLKCADVAEEPVALCRCHATPEVCVRREVVKAARAGLLEGWKRGREGDRGRGYLLPH